MSELAIKLIRNEKEERTGKLDLGNCGLTDFPEELFELDWLEELNFCNEYEDNEQQKWIKSPNKGGNNYINRTYLPESFARFSHLKALRIGGWFLENWQINDCAVLGELHSLTSLSLSSNKISDYSFLEKLTTLTSLSLSSNKISDYSFLEKLTALTSLSLSSNKISDYSFLEKLTALTSLDLSFNKISGIRFLEKLTALTSLSLSFNKISDIRFLEKLTALTSLDLSYNKISDIRFLEKLTALTSLDLSYNKISDYSFLEKLTALTSLDLSENKISGIRFLEKLTTLTSLDLHGNQISDIRFLEKLTALTSLDLRGNQISDIRFLEKLTALTSLYLRYNQISNIRFLEKLTALTSLDLSSNQISDIRFLEKLTALTSLYLSDNQISDYSFLEKLTGLTSLDLSYNQISDIRFLEKLTALTSLDLSYNKISDYSFLEKLTALTSLDLRENQISDYSFLEKLTTLTSLSLRYNQISDIRFLEKLTALTSLNLSNNQISDIRFLEKLTALTSLDLRENQINNIQALLPLMQKGVPVNLEEYGGGGTSLYKNPIVKPPMNIVEQGADAILTYFKQLQQGSEKLYEARIVIVGEPGAGKTTLFRKLENENIQVPDPNQKSTHGININPQKSFKHSNGAEIKASVWDFGGQDTQNYLHQYFYAKDNLFILVCDHRAEKYRFDYWFEMITRLCAESTVIIVRNQNERETAGQALVYDEYEKRFPSLKISRVDVDLKKNDARWNLLIQTIEENLSAMQRVNQEVPRKWKPMRDAIEDWKKSNKPYIAYTEFEKICSQNDLTEKSHQVQCLEYLHWLGLALHYDDLSLTQTIFIDPKWITTGLYEILKEDNYTQNNKGRFTEKDIQHIWKERSTSDQNLLLSLLLKDQFEVCYKVENTKNYLVPVLIDNIKKEPTIKNDKPYTLRFKFPFMPFGFFSRLIVRLYDKIWDNYVWLTGVWIKDECNCIAKLEHLKDINSGEEVFEISIYGDIKDRKELLATIRNEIFHIRKLLFPNLIIEEQIPCFCSKCLALNTPYFHSRIDLEKMAANNQFYSQCKNSGELMPTSTLLDSIINTEELKKQYREMEKSEKVYIDLHDIGNPNIKINTLANAKAEATAKNEITTTINNILGEIQSLKEDFEDEKKLLLNKGIAEDDYEVTLKDIGKAETAIQELETAQKQDQELPAKSKNRLKRFIDDLSDENSTLHKGLKLLRKGRDYGVNLAEMYNKIAANTGMPAVPPLALEVIKKL
jgi:small GTP-binding protein